MVKAVMAEIRFAECPECHREAHFLCSSCGACQDCCKCSEDTEPEDTLPG